MDQLLAELSFSGRLGYGESVGASFAVRDHDFRDPTCCTELPLDDAIAMGLYPAPIGYPGGYTAFIGHLEATADTRSPERGGGSGVRVAAAVDLGSANQGLGSWLRGSGTVGAFWDVAGSGRVLGLTASAAMVEPLGDEDDVPFLELIDFGGGAAMPGFRGGRLRGRSGASASLRYEWPVWAALAGSLQVEVGNVFGPKLEDFDTSLLRLSAVIGLRSMGANDHELQFVLGFGTETFDQGAELTSIRFAIGGTYGF
jgi:outer membrane protein assembly factor BamA